MGRGSVRFQTLSNSSTCVIKTPYDVVEKSVQLRIDIVRSAVRESTGDHPKGSDTSFGLLVGHDGPERGKRASLHSTRTGASTWGG